MANDITIRLKVDDQGSMVIDRFASASGRKLRDFTAKADSDMQRFSASIQKNWAALTAGAASVTAAVYQLKKFVDAYMEAEKAGNNLAKAMANANRLTNANMRDLKDYAAAVQVATGADDDMVIGQMALLQTFRSVNGGIAMTSEQLKTTYAAAADLAAARNIDLESAVKLLGKAFGGSTATLGKFGIKISESVPEAERFAVVLEKIQSTMGGSAAAQMNTYAGQVQYLGAVWGDFSENVGLVLLKVAEAGLMVSNTLVVSFATMAEAITKILATLSTETAAIIEKIPFIGAGAASGLKGAGGWLGASGDAFGQMADNAIAELGRLGTAITTFGDTDYEKTYTNTAAGIGEIGEAAEKSAKQTIDLAREMEKLQDIMAKVRSANATAGLDEWAQKEFAVTEKWLKVMEEMNKQARLVGLSAEEVSKNQEEIARAMGGELAEVQAAQAEEAVREQVKIAEEGQKEQERLLKEQESASRDTYNNMAGFFRDALTQMDSSAGSFIDSLISKFKNLAASIAANALTSIAMNAMGGLAFFVPGMSGMLGMGGGGSGGGMDLMSLLSGGKTAYGAYNNGTLSPFFGGGQLSINTSLPASLGGGPLASGAESMSWLGAGAGALGIGAGGYGIYNAYQSGSPGMGALSGAGAGLGAVTLAASGALGSTLAGAAAGSVVPIVGTIIGAAVGAAIAAFGMSAASDAKDEARLAANYYRGVGRAANADISNMSLSQYVAGGSSVMNPEGIDAAIEIGGLGGTKNIDALYQITEVGKAYKDAVEQFAGSSGQAIGQFSRLQSTMTGFAATSATWTGDAAKLAQQYLVIFEKTKTLQIKELTTQLQSGVGLFSATIDKLRAVGMDAAELNSLIVSEGLKFLTDDTMPALYGELTLVRDAFKEASEEAKKLAEQEAALSVKQQILLSDMELTEAQLRTLKYGEVNTDLIALYTALGWTDKELVLVTSGTERLATAWEALSDAGTGLKADLQGIAAIYKDLDADQIPEAAMRLYGNLQRMAAQLELVGTAGEKLSALPDVFDAMGEAIENADLAGFNSELLQMTNTLMYASGAAGSLGLGKIADLLGGAGSVASYAYAAIEVVQLLQRATENMVTNLAGNTEIYDWMVDNLNKISAKYPKFAAKWLGIVNGGADVTGTLNDYSGMDFGGAVAVGQKYTGANPYTQQAQIRAEAAQAIKVLEEEIAGYAKGGITDAEQQAIDAANALINSITTGSEEAADKVLETWTAAFDDLIKTIQDKIDAIDNSAYNVFLNPSQMTANLGGDFRSELAQFESASPEEMAAAFGDLSGAADQYLQQALATYRSSSAYQAIYAEVMSALEQAKLTVGDKKEEYLSKYEIDQITYSKTTAENTAETNRQLVRLRDKMHEILVETKQGRKEARDNVWNILTAGKR